MALVINSNIASLNAQRNLTNTQSAVQSAMQRLSSGLRINSAKDDAAGLAISQRMSAQIKSLNQGIRNANDGISMIQTAEGALDQVQTMLLRMRELATQASSDTIGTTERGYIDTELQQLLGEVDNIATRTKFNGNNLLTGALSTANAGTGTAAVGAATGINASITNVNVTNASANKTYTFSNAAGVVTLSDGVNSQAIDISAGNLNIGTGMSMNFDKLGVSLTITAAATGAKTLIAAGLAAKTVITAAGSATANLYVGADFANDNRVQVAFSDARITGGTNAGMLAVGTALSNYNGGPTALLGGAISTAVDTALDAISTQRAAYGAAQNRLTNAVASLQTTSENLSAAKSQVTDADFAAETAALTRGQILQQAGQAMLAQANSAPNQVLTLLRNLG